MPNINIFTYFGLIQNMKYAVFWDVALCSLVRTDVSEKRVASIFRVERIL
jgi:hypothetical protein